ncbi:hypothetical protein [Edaphobacter albus]|uniref:hypothetical protein n=1 Tax=Edaphobacter sp. 4G125 TaxID=2763071 RepID=UPI002102FDA0|nr:hypothetical protein [Edaphobacter sp. 4G125]
MILMTSLEIQSFSYDERSGVLPGLIASLADCGGWVLDRRTLSTSMTELKIEVQLRSILDLYSSIVAIGLELTRSSHIALTDLCTCRRNLTSLTDLGQVITIRMEISFLEEVTLHSLLNSGSPPA